MTKHMLSLMDWTAEDLRALLDLSAEIKADPLGRFDALTGKTLAMIFEKPSTRTRVSFEAAMNRLGGQAMFLSPSDMQLGRGETIEDTAQVLSRFVEAIMARVFSHTTVEKLATGSVPIINGLSDLLHPCQALADALTLRERFGEERGVELAYLGDGNNVCHSLINAAARLGIRLRVGTPAGYEPAPTIIAAAREAGADITLTTDPKEAVAGAQAIYTDVWTSMGDEAEAAERTRAFEPFRVDGSLMALASPEAVFLHCLPAHRGEEVTAEVLDGPQSVVFDQAENRMHTEQALLFTLMAGA